jgi:hypothetical protein
MPGAADVRPVESVAAAGALSSLRRVLAMALLPASILPVALFGPALLRAPERLWLQARAEVQRLQRPDRSPRAQERRTP